MDTDGVKLSLQVTGENGHKGLAAAFTAPDSVQAFVMDQGIQVSQDMHLTQMKGTALFSLLHLDQTNAGTSTLAFNIDNTALTDRCVKLNASEVERLFMADPNLAPV